MAVDSRGRPLAGTRRPLRTGTIAEPRPGYFVVRLRDGSDEHGRRVVHRRAGRVDRAVAEAWLIEMGGEPRSVTTAPAVARIVERPQRPARPPRPVGPRFPVDAIAEALRRRAFLLEVGVPKVLGDLAGVNKMTAARWLARG